MSVRMIASPQREVLQTPVGDPSKETKEDLAVKGTSCLMDAGAAMKFIVRNSHLHENMDRTAKDFAAQEPVMDSTHKLLVALNTVMGDLHMQADRIQRCFDELPNVQSSVDSCRALIKPSAGGFGAPPSSSSSQSSLRPSSVPSTPVKNVP
eukprot:TRINITY_DN6781_c0_g1_i1.p1 TRINITY_DN6781_c0_g1~~TRINITY_DN6781_c0_g1_i1.p1  ORF type:complete len:151 (-),score=21.82 TRINITY_DN6781_c0_g1_i1:145-597(-)